MTAYEQSLYRGIRQVRRVARRVNTEQEALDRRLKALLLRKHPPKRRQEVQPAIDQYYRLKKAVSDLEMSFAKDYVSYIE